MTNHNTKKSLKASGLALFVCIAMLIGTTFAWFTDSITNSGNKIESGSLDITFEEWDGTKYVDASKTPIFNYKKWEPGYTDIAAVKIANNGTLALKYQIDFISEEATEDSKKLAEAIEVYYKDDANAAEEGMPTDLTDFDKIGTLADFLDNKDNAATGILKANGNADYAMVALHMPESVGNEYQKLRSSYFDIMVRATQLNSEEDGFGNPDYDEDATLPWDGKTETPVTPDEDGNYDIATPANLAWLADEINNGTTNFNGKTITLDGDINLNNQSWEPIVFNGADSGVTFDGNGHTIKNLKVDGMADGSNGLTKGFGGGFIAQAAGKIVVKDLKFDHVTIAPEKPGLYNATCNVVGIVMGYTYGETLFDNVQVTNSTVEGYGKVGVMVGMGADPGVKITFKDCVSKNNTIKAAYNAGGLAGLIQRKDGVDNTTIENCTVEGNTFDPYDGKNFYADLTNVKAIYKSNDQKTGTDIEKTVNGKYWINGTYYWGAYGKYYVSYGSSSYDPTIISGVSGSIKLIANSEICINNISDIPKN